MRIRYKTKILFFWKIAFAHTLYLEGLSFPLAVFFCGGRGELGPRKGLNLIATPSEDTQYEDRVTKKERREARLQATDVICLNKDI